jgi:D-arabinose 1-dehydrogenase-like Zn-dependent alcohol dehydrogenase
VKGRIALLKEYQKPLEIREFDVPDPEPGAIVVKLTQAGLCGSDLHVWRGDFAGRPLPETGLPLGHEGVGIIHSLGSGVTTDFMEQSLKEGDRIIFAMGYPCYRCLYCLSGEHNHCRQWKLNFKQAGGEWPYFVSTYADFLYLPPMHPVFKVPDSLDDDMVVALNCALGTVFRGLEVAGAQRGQTIVTQGAGGLGLYTVALAKDLGAGCIIAIDGLEPRLALAKELGADETININELKTPEERIERVKEITGGLGADIVVELVGLGELMPEGISMLAFGGTFVEIGNLMPGRTATIEPRVLLKTKRIVGSIAYRPSTIPTMINFLVRNQRTLPLHKLISHKFALADISDAFEQSEWSGRSTPVIRSSIVP